MHRCLQGLRNIPRLYLGLKRATLAPLSIQALPLSGAEAALCSRAPSPLCAESRPVSARRQPPPPWKGVSPPSRVGSVSCPYGTRPFSFLSLPHWWPLPSSGPFFLHRDSGQPRNLSSLRAVFGFFQPWSPHPHPQFSLPCLACWAHAPGSRQLCSREAQPALG